LSFSEKRVLAKAQKSVSFLPIGKRSAFGKLKTENGLRNAEICDSQKKHKSTPSFVREAKARPKNPLPGERVKSANSLKSKFVKFRFPFSALCFLLWRGCEKAKFTKKRIYKIPFFRIPLSVFRKGVAGAKPPPAVPPPFSFEIYRKRKRRRDK